MYRSNLAYKDGGQKGKAGLNAIIPLPCPQIHISQEMSDFLSVRKKQF
jgi:hypothetical protein